jgi:hypothetical protein
METEALITQLNTRLGQLQQVLSFPNGLYVVGSYLLGDVLYADTVNSLTRLPGNLTTTKEYLSQTGTGSASAGPAWAQVAFADVSGRITYPQLPTGGGTWANGGALSITGGITTVAGLTSSALVTASAGLTVASGQTLTLTGATVAGAPTWSSNQAITLSTAAQPNITSVGTLTSLTSSGPVNITHATPFGLTNSQLVTVALTAQTLGAATITIPNFAQVNDTFAFLTLAQQLDNKTLNASIGKGTWTASGTWTLPSLTLTGTVSGTPTWNSNQAITLATAAQSNVTSVGTLTGLTVSGDVTFSGTDNTFWLSASADTGLTEDSASGEIILSQPASATRGWRFKYGTNTRLFVNGSSGAITITTPPGFVAADKYVTIDSSGNLHVSAVGPAS